MHYLDKFVFGIYPYIVLTIFVVGCLIRFEREQYSWKSDSSQLLYRGQLRFGNYCFHLGILGLFFGHFFGLLTPVWVWGVLGISHSEKQIVAMAAGGVMGIMCFIGLLVLIHRRFASARVLAISNWRDKLLLVWLLLTVSLGLSTIFVSAHHTDGHEMLQLIAWIQHTLTFRGDAINYIIDVSPVFKFHLFMGMTVFALFPFTRLVHIFSGFAMVTYITRRWQLVRPRS